ADFQVVVNWGRKKLRLQACEFSEYGVLLAGSDQTMVGEDLSLQLTLESSKAAVNLEGVAIYSNDRGVGGRFKNVSPENQILLKQYVQERGIGRTSSRRA